MNDTVKLTNYDGIADVYTAQAENELSWNNLYERPYMLSIFDDFKNKNVLDVGCGTGFYSFYSLKQNANVIAVDASQNMLNYVEKKDKFKKIKLFKADLKDGLPFIESDSQDFIICSLVLHYIENWETIINDFYRVLKNNGKLYISTHHPFADFLCLKKESYFTKDFVEDRWGSKEKPFTVHYYTRSLTELLKPFLNSKFNITAIEEPLPTQKCKELAPDIYQRLLERPNFIFLTLEKNNG
jgi:ubiquinone/menaquinone biosynthesis C-methylase UbiE